MRSVRSLLLYVTGFGCDVASAFGLLILWLFWGTRLRLEKKPGKAKDGRPFPGNWSLTCEIKNGKLKLYTYGGTTWAPHVRFYREGWPNLGGWSEIQEHEEQHGEQLQAASVAGAAMAATHTGSPVAALVIFIVAPWVIMLAAYITAWLRGESIYRGASTEEAAYAIADDYDTHP